MGPDGRPIDPALAARLAKNPNLMVGHMNAPGGNQRPKMEIDVAVSAESVKKTEEVISRLKAEAVALREMFDNLLEQAAELQIKLEALKNAIHT